MHALVWKDDFYVYPVAILVGVAFLGREARLVSEDVFVAPVGLAGADLPGAIAIRDDVGLAVANLEARQTIQVRGVDA